MCYARCARPRLRRANPPKPVISKGNPAGSGIADGAVTSIDNWGASKLVFSSEARDQSAKSSVSRRSVNLFPGSAAEIGATSLKVKLNVDPRKCLGFQTPLEAFSQQLGVALEMLIQRWPPGITPLAMLKLHHVLGH